jgi:hypothetical protein
LFSSEVILIFFFECWVGCCCSSADGCAAVLLCRGDRCRLPGPSNRWYFDSASATTSPAFWHLVLTHLFSPPTLNQSRRKTFFPFSNHIRFLSANASFFLLFYTRYHNVLPATIFLVCYKSRLLLSFPSSSIIAFAKTSLVLPHISITSPRTTKLVPYSSSACPLCSLTSFSLPLCCLPIRHHGWQSLRKPQSSSADAADARFSLP